MSELSHRLPQLTSAHDALPLRACQVELDHARLAMLAVLLSGAVGAGAGAGAGVYMNAHDGL